MCEEPSKRLRFKYEDDIITLREVVSRDPFTKGKECWEEIQNSIFLLTRKRYSIKSIRQHLMLLLEQWKKKERKNEKSSGIEEPYSERDTLLQEMNDLIEESKLKYEKPKITPKTYEKKQIEIAKEIREKTASNFLENIEIHDNYENFDEDGEESTEVIEFVVENEMEERQPEATVPTVPSSSKMIKTHTLPEASTEPGIENIEKSNLSEKGKSKARRRILEPIRNRAKRTSYIRRSGLEYLEEKNKKDLEIEEKRLRIEERKVAVSERKIELEEKRFLFDSEHYKNMFNSQQQIIKGILDIKNISCSCSK